MLLKRLKNFKEETERRYKEGLKEHMPSWKEDVMILHEKSEFLFYFDEFTDCNAADGSCIALGSYAKGKPKPGTILYFYNGQAELLAKAILTQTVEQAEEKMSGFTKEKRYLCSMRLARGGRSEEEMRNRFWELGLSLSLITELSPEGIKT